MLFNACFSFPYRHLAKRSVALRRAKFCPPQQEAKMSIMELAGNGFLNSGSESKSRMGDLIQCRRDAMRRNADIACGGQKGKGNGAYMAWILGSLSLYPFILRHSFCGRHDTGPTVFCL
jgi:hypothetical protein